MSVCNLSCYVASTFGLPDPILSLQRNAARPLGTGTGPITSGGSEEATPFFNVILIELT